MAGEGSLPAALLPDLQSPEFPVREEAFARLMAWARENPEQALSDLPREHPDPEIAHRLGEIRRHVEFSGNPLWKGALATAGDTPELRGAIEALVGAPSAATVAGLSQAAGPQARLFWRVLAAQLDHPDHEVCTAAIRELVRLQAIEAGPEISRLLADGKHPRARHSAAAALGQLRCVEAVPLLVESLKMDRSTRSAARQALFTIADPSAPPLIAALLDDPVDDIRREAIGLLNQLKSADPAAVSAVAACLESGDEGMQFAAAGFLSRMAGLDCNPLCPVKERVQLARDWWNVHKSDPEFAPGK